MSRQNTHCPKGHVYAGDNLIISFTSRGKHRQCRTCHSECVRNNHAANPERQRAYRRKSSTTWRRANPEKIRAQNTLYDAVKQGKLKRPKFCQLCLGPCKAQAHHEDYTKRLEVVWLCAFCHKHIHQSSPKRINT